MHRCRIFPNSGSSIRIEVNPSQSHCLPVPLTKPSMVFATSSRVLFIGRKKLSRDQESGKAKDGCEMRNAKCEMRDGQKLPLPEGEGRVRVTSVGLAFSF